LGEPTKHEAKPSLGLYGSDVHKTGSTIFHFFSTLFFSNEKKKKKKKKNIYIYII